MAIPVRYFCVASYQNVFEAAKQGILNTMPINQELDPINSTNVRQIQTDGGCTEVTDLKLRRYVRMISDPCLYVTQRNGDISSLFIFEIDPEIILRPDVIKVKRLLDGQFEWLKAGMISPSFFKQICVFSKEIEKKITADLAREEIHIPVVTDPNLFVLAEESPKSLISLQYGNLLDSPMQAHVNTVNCVGVMGKGIAEAFKKEYPTMFKDYRTKCERKEVQLGKPYCFLVSPDKIVVNFPTKGHWRENSSLEDIENGLKYLVAHAKEWGIQSIAVPALGCSNGHLNWEDVFPLLQHYLPQLGIPVEIYPPQQSVPARGEKRSAPQAEPDPKRRK